MSLYFILLIGSIVFPLFLSFDKKVAFYKNWPALLPAISIVATVFILCDVVLTHHGTWGFNPEYHSNIKLLGLPLEEFLFFLIIPYASLFIHLTLRAYFPDLKLGKRITNWLSISIILVLALILIFNIEKEYTTYIVLKLMLVLLISLWDKNESTRIFFISFLVILIPFTLVDGILTGSFIQDEVVWYNSEEIIGIRILTIPLEDYLYGFAMLLSGLMLFNSFDKKQRL